MNHENNEFETVEPTRVSMMRAFQHIEILFSLWVMDEITGRYNPCQYRMVTRVQKHTLAKYNDGLLTREEFLLPLVSSFADQITMGTDYVLSIDHFEAIV